MKKKVLFTATVDSHILHFHIPYLKMFHENGYEVHVATNGATEIPYCDVKHTVSFQRSPFHRDHLKAMRQLKNILEEEYFDIIHTHTPMGSVVTRLAAKKTRKKGTKVIYTAHGFHFFKGAPLSNWLLFYPVEKLLSRYTDILITINKEDYALAKQKFHALQTYYVPGVGVDPTPFQNIISEDRKNQLKKKIYLNSNDYVLICIGELNRNKNQLMLIQAMEKVASTNTNIKLLLVGTGVLEQYYIDLVKDKNLQNTIQFLGYRRDVPDLLKISDVLISVSKREGLPVNVIEGLISGLPVIVTNGRGNSDLVEENNGYLVETGDIDSLAKYILKMYEEKNVKNYYSDNISQYHLGHVSELLRKIYFGEDNG